MLDATNETLPTCNHVIQVSFYGKGHAGMLNALLTSGCRRILGGVCIGMTAGCGLFLRVPDIQCQTNADCEEFGPQAVCDVAQQACIFSPADAAKPPGSDASSGLDAAGSPIRSDAEGDVDAAVIAPLESGVGDTVVVGAIDASREAVVGADADLLDAKQARDEAMGDAACDDGCVGDAGVGDAGVGDAGTDAVGDAGGTVDVGSVVDSCPNDPAKTSPGLCGCGRAEPPADAGAAFCLRDFMIHRYSFNGTGAIAVDSIARADGMLLGASQTMAGGSVALAGDLNAATYAGEDYVALPSRILSNLTSATFEIWLTWSGVGAVGEAGGQHVFDFGSQAGTGPNAVGQTYLFLEPSSLGDGPMLAGFRPSVGQLTLVRAAATGALPLGVEKHAAVVVDGERGFLSVYLDGAPVGTVAITGSLANIDDADSWLGRSQFANNPEFHGLLHEFRIYGAALTATQVAASFAAGENPFYLP